MLIVRYVLREEELQSFFYLRYGIFSLLVFLCYPLICHCHPVILLFQFSPIIHNLRSYWFDMVHTDLTWDLTHFAKVVNTPQIQLCLLTVYVSLECCEPFPGKFLSHRVSRPSPFQFSPVSSIPVINWGTTCCGRQPPKVVPNDPWLLVFTNLCNHLSLNLVTCF